jgi:hypothetical protein
MKNGEPGWQQERHAQMMEELQASRQLSALYGSVPFDGSSQTPFTFIKPTHMLSMCRAAAATPPGTFVEIGVYRGGSAWHLTRLAIAQRRPIYLCDTFAGMPYSDPSIDTIPVGEVNGPAGGGILTLEQVRRDLGTYPLMVAGTFPHVTVGPMAPIAFAHIDVDQYQAHIETCLALAPWMTPGGVMWFDDVTDLESARKAVRELYAGRIQVDPVSSRWYVRF